MCCIASRTSGLLDIRVLPICVITQLYFCIDSATESIRMLCLFKCQSSHQHSTRLYRFKGAVSELDLRDFCQQPRFQKAFRSEGRAIIDTLRCKSSERLHEAPNRLLSLFVEPYGRVDGGIGAPIPWSVMISIVTVGHVLGSSAARSGRNTPKSLIHTSQLFHGLVASAFFVKSSPG